MNNNIVIEVCADGIESAIAAQKGGAHRIELCSGLSLGGLTPSKGLMEGVLATVKIPVYVLIRPRSGDFLYTRAEYNVIKSDIFSAKVAGAQGIVIGMLNSDATVDTCRMKEIIEMCNPLPVTFHRAFDMVNNPLDALEQIIELGCERILTSGGHKNALQGADNIKDLNLKADHRIAIMAGSGINEDNFIDLVKITGCKEYHLSAASLHTGKMKTTNTNLDTEFPNAHFVTNSKRVASICTMASSLK